MPVDFSRQNFMPVDSRGRNNYPIMPADSRGKTVGVRGKICASDRFPNDSMPVDSRGKIIILFCLLILAAKQLSYSAC